jgi:hypothetical protein
MNMTKNKTETKPEAVNAVIELLEAAEAGGMDLNRAESTLLEHSTERASVIEGIRQYEIRTGRIRTIHRVG